MSDSSINIPEEFSKVIRDFVCDLKITFPEYLPFIDKWWKDETHFNNISDELERKNAIEQSENVSIKFLFDFCKKKLPPRFFDILYQNDEMFKEDSKIDTEFFPKIHFKNLWQCDISDKTRETIWKYLQLILFSVIGTLDNKDAFGDTAKLFEAINEDEFKTKLQETIGQMQGLFDGVSPEQTDELNQKELPDPEQINNHITGMLDGKIGQLAKEVAEEFSDNINMDFDGATDIKDVFSKLMKNPTKLMGLVKNVGDKLDSKLKSGELKESEMIQEATELMNKMKNMPGMGNIQDMLSKMGMGGMTGMGKMNTKAMESNLNQRMKVAKMKERIRAKADANAKAKAEQATKLDIPVVQHKTASDEELIKLFSSGEKIERTPRMSNNNTNTNTNNSNKKKKGKK